jgi:3-hydroxyisobutyrate dehydrogenase-like beta-hydroxyacid dehydrogenase
MDAHVTASWPPPAVAMVGTGRMGAAMAGRMRAAGLPVTAWNRTRAKAEEVASATGASVAATPREAAAAADVVLCSLADDDAVRAAYGGPDGIVAGLRAGAVVADTSTVDPETVRALAPDVEAAGATLLDTPVSGSVSVVESGQLTVMAGGDAAALDRARPALDTFAKAVTHVGALGAGATMKLVVNTLLIGLNQALAESLVLAERAGVDREAAYEVIASSAVAAPFVHYKRDAYERPGETPVAFSLDLVAKDLALALMLAGRVGARVDQAVTDHALAREAVADGFGDHDLSALAVWLRG